MPYATWRRSRRSPANEPVTSPFSRAWQLIAGKAEQGLAVAAAEQEDEPLPVAAQLGQAVGGVADELCQGVAQAGGVAAQPLAEELQHFGEFGGVGDVASRLRDGKPSNCR